MSTVEPNFEIVQSEADITTLLQADAWRMGVLRAASRLNLHDWWVGAGFLRNLIWDALEGNKPVQPRDIDLVYFNPDDIAPETDWAYDQQMAAEFPGAEWEVRNQARMHYVNDLPPFTSTADGISHWVETATCVGVRLEGDQLRYLFCHGTDDLLGLIARPTQTFTRPDTIQRFHQRVAEKRWRERWPHLQVIES